MPPAPTQLDRINHIEYVQSGLLDSVKELLCHFCYYWKTERQRVLAIITKLDGNAADIVAISNSWSGGLYEISGVEMLIRPEGKPDDEIKKEGKWEPLLAIKEVLEEELKKAAVKEPETPKLLGKKADVSSSSS